jgi:phenylacetate-coenzyme A ligase PaaK-like adenylate-forming protein
MTRFTPSRFRQSKLPVIQTSKLRAAQLTAAASFEGADAFPPERWRDLKTFAPNVLIGPASALQRLMERMDLPTLELTSVDHAVFVLTEVGDKPVSDSTRAVLWQHFGVPVYELYLDSRGVLLASECEAQDGWHVESGARFFLQNRELMVQSTPGGPVRTGLVRFLESARCACGRSGTRILDPELHVDEEALPFLAATA